MTTITSNFAVLDVKDGRHELAQRLTEGWIPIVIRGQLKRPNNNDDGISMEFEVEVESVELSK